MKSDTLRNNCISKIWARIKTFFKQVCPYLRIFVPDVKTVCLLYVLVMAFVLRGLIDNYLTLHFSEQLEKFCNLLGSSALVNWATTLFLIMSSVLLLKRDIKRKAYSWPIIISGFAVIYLLFNNNWDWAQSPLGINYKILLIIISFVFFVCGCYRLVMVLTSIPAVLKDLPDKKGGLTNSTPEDLRQDTGWKPYAANMVSKLIATDLGKESFAVGISGIWGGGKSTFLDAIKQEFKGKAYLLDFRPWYCESPDQITKDFFETFIEGLSISSYQRRSIHKYAKLLGSLGPVKPFVDPVVSLMDSGERSLGEAKKKAEDVIGSFESPVVMIIDDLDRLDERELLCVLKLIRTSANFRNLIFILAYDKKYLAQALKNVGGEDFLKKIVQLEVCLPDYESYIMLQFLLCELERKGIEKSVIEKIKRRFVNLRHSIDHFLPTFRDVNRFVNLFSLNLNSFLSSKTESEISIRDLFFVELLHYYDEDAYQYLRTCPEETLFPMSDSSGFRTEYQLSKPSFQKKKRTHDEQLDSDPVSRYKEGVRDLLEILFSVSGDEEEGLIRYPINFAKYFSFRVNKNVISINEYHELLECTDVSIINDKIYTYSHGGANKCPSLFSHLLSSYVDRANKTSVFNLVYSLLELHKYYEFDISRIGSFLFEDIDFYQESVVWEAFTEAVKMQCKSYKWVTDAAQVFVASVVKICLIDRTYEDPSGYEPTEDVKMLSDLSKDIFNAHIGDKDVPIGEITNYYSEFHNYLHKALALVGQEVVRADYAKDITQSLIIDALIDYYSKKDNSGHLDEFFDNLHPGRNGDVGEEGDSEDDLVKKNIQSIFGNWNGFGDFFSFLKAAFPNQIPQVNKRLVHHSIGYISIDRKE